MTPSGREVKEQVREALGRHTEPVVAWNGPDAMRRMAYGEQPDEFYREVRDPIDRAALAALDGCVVLTAEEAKYVLRHMGADHSYAISPDETSDAVCRALLGADE